MIVEKKLTPVDFESSRWANDFALAWQAAYGRLPWREEAEWLTGMAILENMNGRAVFNWNIGNLVPRKQDDRWIPSWADPQRDITTLSKNEAATRRRYEAGESVPGAFAAFPNLKTGIQRYVSLFKSLTHDRILLAAQKDDAELFVKAVATPHPVTKMMYCVECYTPAHKASYQRLKTQVHNSHVFEGLASFPKGEPALPA